MKTPCFPSRIVAIAFLAALSSSIAFGQAPGGRGGAATMPSPAQQAAINAINTRLQPLQDKVTAAQTALGEATFAFPRNSAALTQATAVYSAALQELALARAAEFAALQSSDSRLSPDLVALVVASAANGGQLAAGRGGRGGGQQAAPAEPDDFAGFTSLFDGRSLDGWDGDPQFWRVEDGTIIAESTPEKVVTDNTFLIWRGGTPDDFELKVDARFAGNSGNSGIQVRSRPLTAPTSRSGGEPRPWGMAGYQIDMVPAGGTGTALIYGEGPGGGFMARQGLAMRRTNDGSKQIATLGDGIADLIKPAGEWNHYHIIARGNQITVFVNGRLSALLMDEATASESYARSGLIALQMHVGQPFRLEFKNIYLKEL